MSSNKFSHEIYNSYKDLPNTKTVYPPMIFPKNNLINRLKRINTNRIRDNHYKFSLDIFSNITKSEIKSVVDYGGDVGLSFFLFDSVFNIESYLIIELEKLCKIHQQYWNDTEYNVKFILKISDVTITSDIIYSWGGFPYTLNSMNLLQDFINLNPKYIILENCDFCDVPTHLRIQNYQNSNIPVWFTNKDDAIELASKNNYELISYTKFENWKHPLQSVDSKHNIDKTYNIAFKKE